MASPAETPPKDAGSNKRRVELQAIHVRVRQLGLDDAVYRALLMRVSGLASAGEMNATQRAAVLDELRRLGGRSHRTREREGKRPSEPQERLMAALWRELGALGALKDPSEQGLRHFARRLTGVASPRWLDAISANRVIESLKSWLRRERQKQGTDKPLAMTKFEVFDEQTT